MGTSFEDDTFLFLVDPISCGLIDQMTESLHFARKNIPNQ
jgi:hypothetical protein